MSANVPLSLIFNSGHKPPGDHQQRNQVWSDRTTEARHAADCTEMHAEKIPLSPSDSKLARAAASGWGWEG